MFTRILYAGFDLIADLGLDLYQMNFDMDYKT